MTGTTQQERERVFKSWLKIFQEHPLAMPPEQSAAIMTCVDCDDTELQVVYRKRED